MKTGQIVSFKALYEFVKSKRANMYIEVADGAFYVPIVKKFLADNHGNTAEVTFQLLPVVKNETL